MMVKIELSRKSHQQEKRGRAGGREKRKDKMSERGRGRGRGRGRERERERNWWCACGETKSTFKDDVRVWKELNKSTGKV